MGNLKVLRTYVLLKSDRPPRPGALVDPPPALDIHARTWPHGGDGRHPPAAHIEEET